MRISDCSADVCASDLKGLCAGIVRSLRQRLRAFGLHQFEITLEDSDEIDDSIGTGDRARQTFRTGNIRASDLHLPQSAQRLQKKRALRIAAHVAPPHPKPTPEEHTSELQSPLRNT